MSRINRRYAVTKVTRGTGANEGRFLTDTRADTVTAEEPLEIRAGGETLTTTMRTPGHDIELAHGWLYTEGLIKRAEDVTTARYCAGAVGPAGKTRTTYSTLTSPRQPRPFPPTSFGLPPPPAPAGCAERSQSARSSTRRINRSSR